MLSLLAGFESKTVMGAAVLLGASALVSRLLGLFRDRLLAGTFGAGPELDAYFAAFRVPDFVFGVFVLGGVSAVFLPLFSELKEKGRERAWEFVSNLLHALFLGLGVLALVLFLLAPWLMRLVAPGFAGDQLETATSLTRLMLLSPVLFGVSAVFSGVLQYFSRFLAYAAAPVLYNLGIIFGIVFLAPALGVWGVAWGVLAGAALHLAVQVPPALAAGFSWRAVFRFLDPALLKAARLAVPRTLGGAAYHINLVAMTAFASLLPAGSIAVFAFADNLQSAPVGLIGIPFALAVFPRLSRAVAQNEGRAFGNMLVQTLRKVAFLVFPVAVVLFLFREEIIRVIFRTGAFGPQDVQLTAAVFGVFVSGVLFQALIPVLARAFFALQDTKTPTAVGIATVLLNIALAWGFLQLFSSFGEYRIIALPLALVASGFVQCSLLGALLWRRMQRALG